MLNIGTKSQLLHKVVVFGVGLIGGSFALALKQRLTLQVVGFDRDQQALQRALALGIIDEVGTDLALALQDAELVLIAAPVGQTAAILKSICPHLQRATIVTDAGSTKSDVVLAARQVMGDKIGQFVPAHPVAGRELSGPDAALPDLFVGKKVVITAMPDNRPSSLTLVASVWQCCGAQIHHLSALQHDQIFAAVSHLPHLLAYALVSQIADQPDAALRFQFAGTGFQDVTRIAGASPEMWRDISLANRQSLLTELAIYQAQLQGIAKALQAEDGGELLALFEHARAAHNSHRRALSAA